MSQRNELNAFKVVNEYSESALKDVFRLYGELTNAAAIANAICVARDTEAIETSEQLKKVLAKFLPAHKSHKILAQIYQAIRIEVNQEIEVLKEFLEQSKELLEVGGRLSVMSYHSLEDRLVKRYMRDGLFEGEPEKDFFGHIISMPFKKVGGLIIPNATEIGQNNRARSAKLRIAEKL
jgi:16S rRNA (cytosine1402-N4)-methyltransferase